MQYGLTFWAISLLCAIWAWCSPSLAPPLLWAALSLGIVGYGYLRGRASVFGKQANGSLRPLAVALLLIRGQAASAPEALRQVQSCRPRVRCWRPWPTN